MDSVKLNAPLAKTALRKTVQLGKQKNFAQLIAFSLKFKFSQIITPLLSNIPLFYLFAVKECKRLQNMIQSVFARILHQTHIWHSKQIIYCIFDLHLATSANHID